MQGPFFSIIIPSYNREKFIFKTLESFLRQTFSDFEILIVDDGGNDNTRQVTESFKDNRVKYYWMENGERGAARNYGASLAKGCYLNFFDSDDIAYENHLETAKNLIEPDFPALIFLGFEFINQVGKPISRANNYNGDVVANIINQNKRNLNSVFIKRQVFEEIKFEENRLLAASEDTLLLCLLVARHVPIYLNKITSAMVEHNERSMVTSSEEQLINRKRYLLQSLESDKIFMNKYASNLPVISAEMSYLLCLCCLAQKNNSKASIYFKEYLRSPTVNLFSFRTLVFLKKALLNVLKG